MVLLLFIVITLLKSNTIQLRIMLLLCLSVGN